MSSADKSAAAVAAAAGGVGGRHDIPLDVEAFEEMETEGAAGAEVLEEMEGLAAVPALGIEHSFEEVSAGLSTSSLDDAEDPPATSPPVAPASPSPPPPPLASREAPAGEVAGGDGGGSSSSVQETWKQSAPPLRRANRGGRKGPGPEAARRRTRRGGPPLCAAAEPQGQGVEPPDWDQVWSAPGATPRRPVRRPSGRVPDWVTDAEVRRALEDGSGWLERDGTGWYLQRAGSGTERALEPGADYNERLQALEDSRMLGDDDAWRYLQVTPAAQPSSLTPLPSPLNPQPRPRIRTPKPETRNLKRYMAGATCR